MGEHLLCKQGVVGSIPISSTNCRGVGKGPTGSFKRIREETKRERAEASRCAAYLWLFSRVCIGCSLTIGKK